MDGLTRLQIRFGYGFGPGVEIVTPDRMLDATLSADLAAVRYPVMAYDEAMLLERRRKTARGAGSRDLAMELRMQLRAQPAHGLRAAFARILDAEAPLRERLTWFWADHFTVVGRDEAQRAGAAGYIDEAIRPHVMGRFADMLKAVSRHPAMLTYLDQHVSVGPHSGVGQRLGRGLNENYARELLELHTLGVNGSYTQADVRQAAELLTGMTLDTARAFVFRPALTQPGPETVLNRVYGTKGPGQLDDIDAFLDDLACHPETILHLAGKLALHFIGPDAPLELVDALVTAWAESDGDLARISHVLVTHPAARTLPLQNVKQPMTFMASTLLALGVRGAAVSRLSRQTLGRMFIGPLQAMGQPFLWPPGPDGWPHAATEWITPQGLAQRIGWAGWMVRYWGQDIDTPAAFLDATLPDLADSALRFSVSSAETREEALVLVLASPAFNRR